MIPDSPFARLPLAERDAIVAFCARRMGWDEARSVRELESWDHVAIAYLRRDALDGNGCGGHTVDYDPGAELFAQR